MVREENYDVVIVGCGVGGLYTALNLPSEDRILNDLQGRYREL